MIRSLKYFFGTWLRHEKNLESFSPRTFMIYFTILFTIFIIAVIFIANVSLFYIGLTPFYGLEYILLENISLVIFSIIISLLLGYISGSILKELFVSYNKISKLSRTDCLSGLLNHSSFISNLESENGKLSIVFFDIDYFKKINDNFGHPVGDKVISFIADQLVLVFEKPMFVGRLGGEEFAAAALGNSEKEAAILANNLRQIIEKSQIDILNGSSIRITVSAGIAERRNKEPISTIVYQADQALYVAKKSGRNRIVCFSDIK
ncbi:GGDEF domain-containing protein [Candidatus Liberibacter africanus]|uniref:diguanylate cyclase n=1 Tax=Candidatus Liberibacter africanus PTSAPSY TaxID=1277257 RepID=A0A0G3I404_LIBAF|nr:GGDEF domain-containing protein [Candidatus Liberibacter africanus]AKK20621.1 diguanylate cyclase [Candidatus Liberibacter africanus PTSAPSY]QTP64302.1 GGDEF domain-containing protein [Candidatus Liberibacter africanus]